MDKEPVISIDIIFGDFKGGKKYSMLLAQYQAVGTNYFKIKF